MTRLAVGVLAALACLPATARAASIPERTIRVAAGLNGSTPDGASTRPSVSDDGHLVTFDSTAPNMTLDLNGRTRDVFIRDLDGTVALISQPLSGAANGPSGASVISGDGTTIAFESTASNLTEGDTNSLSDVFLHPLGGATVLASTGAAGPANGPSSQADLSADGTRVVFTSAANNLVPGDTNGVTDVFVRDVRANTIQRVSQENGVQGNGASSAPAISPDGRYVSFFSRASNFGPDVNDSPDVFIADLQTGIVERVTVSSSNGQQDRAVIAPFEQISDVSRGGRYVVFDSDATNLVPKDTNKDTDVFVHDVVSGITTRVSLAADGGEADNDSFYPRISPDGRYVAFESFASDLVPGDHRPEDTFVTDRKLHANAMVDVTSSGRQRGPEHVRQLLQRPALSADGRVVAFTTTAALERRDGGSFEDVYARRTDPPRVHLRIKGRRYRISADDPTANLFRCQIRELVGPCKRTGRLPFFGRAYRLSVRGSGPGMLLGSAVSRRVSR